MPPLRWSSTPISVAAMHAIYITYYMFIAGFQENLIAGHTSGVRILLAMTVFPFSEKDTFNKQEIFKEIRFRLKI